MEENAFFYILLIGLCLYIYDLFYLRDKKKHKNKHGEKNKNEKQNEKQNEKKNKNNENKNNKEQNTLNSLDDVLTILNEK